MWGGFGSGQGPVAGFCEYGTEPLCFITGMEFLGWLSDCYLLKKDYFEEFIMFIKVYFLVLLIQE